MTYEEFKKNKEIGKLIQFGYDLHERDLEEFVNMPTYYFYEGNCLHRGRHYKNGGIYGEIRFANHSDGFASVTLVVMDGLDENHKNPKRAAFLQIRTDKYEPSFHKLYQRENEDCLSFDYRFDDLSDDEMINMFVDCMEFLGFIREDILKVINNEMTAKEAFSHVAPEGLKNMEWICYNRKLYVFNGNVAIRGSYGSIHLDEFPFPFKGQPILDCSKVNTACTYFGNNERRVKLINVNAKPTSIKFTDIREAIIEEPIDASKTSILGTIFGEQKVINLDESIDYYEEQDIVLANASQEDICSSKRIKVFSDASTIDTITEGLDNGSEGIALFRDEFAIENNSELVKYLTYALEYGSCDEGDKVCQLMFDTIYHNASNMYSLVGDKDITFRLMNINVKDFLRKNGSESYKEYDDNCCGSEVLIRFRKLLISEARAIIRAAKGNKKLAKILVPYIIDHRTFSDLKWVISEVAEQEGYANVEIGAMIETKKSTNSADHIAKSADFIAIGTNDLTECVLNKKRSIDDPDFKFLNGEVKEAIKKIIYRTKRTRDIPIYVCGEHANYIDNIEYLLSLNIDGITVHSDLVCGFNDLLNRYYESRWDSKNRINGE